jgi:pyruvate dehydrogenase E2 component (dihydrolipoamide acetyltransferase)
MPAPGPRTRISPAARQRAAAAGIPVDTLTGSGPGGAITLADVEQALAAPVAGPARATVAASSGAIMRRAIAAAMARSKREIPHYYLTQALDFSATRDWVARFNAGRPADDRLLYAVPLIKAVALACTEIPGFAGIHRDGQFHPAVTIDVGFAVAQRGGGLVAPGLLDVARKDMPTIMRELKDLVGRVRGGHLRSPELERPVITVTSLGEEGVEAVYPIIFPDQVAIVGAGRIEERAWVLDGRIVPRPVLTLTLAADHRVSDGRAGARFLGRVCALLSAPEQL